MRPTKRRERSPDQQFGETEKLYKRVPREHLTIDGEIEPSLIQCSFSKEVKSAPSVVRSKYGTPRDTVHRLCAGGNDVASNLVFYLEVWAVPRGLLSGDNKVFDFYPYHDPEKDCYAHTVIACRKASSSEGVYDQPSNAVKNAFKAKLISALKPAEISSFPRSFLLDLNKYLSLLRGPRS